MAFNYGNLWSMVEARNLSKNEFGKLVGLSTATVTKLAQDQPVSMDVLERICGVFHCTPNDILTYNPDGLATGKWCTVRMDKPYLVSLLMGRLEPNRWNYIYGWAIPFIVEMNGMDRWELRRSEVADPEGKYRFYVLNGQLTGKKLLRFLTMTEAGNTVGEILDELDIVCRRGEKCDSREVGAIRTIHLCNGNGIYRPPFLLEAHGSILREWRKSQPMSSFTDDVMRCESLYGADKRALYTDSGKVQPAMARGLYLFIKNHLPVKHVGEMARLNNFEIISPLREVNLESGDGQGVFLQIIQDEEAKKRMKHIPRAVRLTMRRDAFQGTYAVRICLRNTNNATLDSIDIVSCARSDVLLEKQLSESVSDVEIWIWDLKDDTINGNLVHHSDNHIARQFSFRIGIPSKSLRGVEDAWSRRTSGRGNGPEDTIEYAHYETTTYGNLDNEAWKLEEEKIASDFAGFIPEASYCEDQGLYLTEEEDQHVRLFRWLKSRLDDAGASRVVIFDPYISMDALEELFHAIRDNGINYEIYTDKKAEGKNKSIMNNRGRLAALSPASFKVIALKKDTLHDRFIMLAGNARIPTVYMLSNSLDGAGKEHSMVVTKLEPALAQTLFEDYVEKVKTWEFNHWEEVLFDSKQAVNRGIQSVAVGEETLSADEITPERFMELLREEPSRALTLMAHMRYHGDIERCRRFVREEDQEEMTKLLSGVIEQYMEEGCPAKDQPNEYQMLVYGQLLKESDTDLMRLYQVASRFQEQASGLYFHQGGWDQHFATRLLWDVNPAKMIELELELLKRSGQSSQNSIKLLACAVYTIGVITRASLEGMTDPQREALLRADNAFLRALGVCLPAQQIGGERKPDRAREIELLSGILPTRDWLAASLWLILEGQIAVCRDGGKDAKLQEGLDEAVMSLVDCAGGNHMRFDNDSIVGLREFQAECSWLIFRNVGDYCRIITGLVQVGCLTAGNAWELLAEHFKKPYLEAIERDRRQFKERNIPDACRLLDALHQISEESIKSIHAWMSKAERKLNARLRNAFLKTLNYTQWKTTVDALCCLAYLELYLANAYHEKPSPAVREFRKVAENYAETLKESSEVYRRLMIDYAATLQRYG